MTLSPCCAKIKHIRPVTEKPTSRFTDNLERLLGLHRLSWGMFGELVGISDSTLSKWQSGARNPSFTTALKVGDFFRVDEGRLARADFGDLLENELADAERYWAVERAIRRQVLRSKTFDEIQKADAMLRDVRRSRVGELLDASAKKQRERKPT